MERKKLFIVVGVALAFALIASAGAYRFLSEKGRSADQARLETQGIAVAVVDIPMGSAINPNQVAVTAWPKGHLPKDSVPSTQGVVGRTVLREFVRGEPIVESKLVPKAGGTGLLAFKVPPGMRAFSVKVNEVVGVGGFIVPGSRVDVVATTAVSSRSQDQVAKIVLEDVVVLAAGQTIEQKDNKPVTVSNVTLAVVPEDAERLALASNDGRIQLILRNFNDAEKVTTAGVDKGRLLASLRAPSAASELPRRARSAAPRKESNSVRREPVKKAYTVEVIKGNKKTEETL